MSTVIRTLTLTALFLCGCASVPKHPIEQSIPSWPESVAEACPERKVSVECFRSEGFPRSAIHKGMTTLEEQLKGCIRREAGPIQISLTVETRGGTPSCVEASVWVNELEKFQTLPWLADDLILAAETARCAASVVARDLVLPESPADAHCRWNMPIHF